MNILPPLIAVVLGALAYFANRELGGPPVFNTIIIVVVVLVIVIWLLGALGMMGDFYIGSPRAD